MILRVHIPGNPWDGRVNVRTGMAWSADRRRAKAYLAEVALWARSAVNAQRWTRLDHEAQCWIVLGVSDRRRRDIDGPIKALLDGLTQGGVWADDSLVTRMIVDKRLGHEGAAVQVRPAG